MERSAKMTDIPNHPLKWREFLTVAAQVAAIISCTAVLTVATITLITYLAH
jgi:hypothetical protein